jgi:hypothetical protein
MWRVLDRMLNPFVPLPFVAFWIYRMSTAPWTVRRVAGAAVCVLWLVAGTIIWMQQRRASRAPRDDQ